MSEEEIILRQLARGFKTRVDFLTKQLDVAITLLDKETTEPAKMLAAANTTLMFASQYMLGYMQGLADGLARYAERGDGEDNAASV